MSQRSIDVASPRRGIAWLCWSGWLYLAAASCAEDAPRDEDRLSSLSESQLRSLCEEVVDAWPAEPDATLECSDGNTHYLDRPALSACGNRTTTCSVTVGEWRDCMRALAETPCETATPEPEQCTRLSTAKGCLGLTLPVVSQCTPPTLDLVTALEGVYRIADRTQNDSGCDAEGGPLPAQGFLALAATTFRGIPLSPLQDTPMLMPVECDSIAECRELVGQRLAAGEFADRSNVTLPDSFVCGPDGTGALRALLIRDNSAEECRLTSHETQLLPQPDGSLRLEFRSFALPEPPEGEPCYLTDEGNGRCFSFQVLRAERVATL